MNDEVVCGRRVPGLVCALVVGLCLLWASAGADHAPPAAPPVMLVGS